ncbi:hypothetical protein ACK8HY_06105 [Sphingobacterium sp. NGMCC 1.201703]
MKLRIYNSPVVKAVLDICNVKEKWRAGKPHEVYLPASAIPWIA